MPPSKKIAGRAEAERESLTTEAELKPILEDAIRAGRVAAAEDILKTLQSLGDEGWNALADQAAQAGFDRSVVLRRRRPKDGFTAAIIEAAYQYGCRQAAEVARGVNRPNPVGGES